MKPSLRPSFARLGALLACSALLAACTSQPTAAPTQAPAAKPTTAAAPAATTAPAAAPTTAPAPAATQPAAGLITVKVANPGGGSQYTPLLTARELGFFQKHGIDLQFVALQSGVALSNALLSGNVDLAITSLDTAVIASAQGQRLQTFGAVSQAPYAALVVSNKIPKLAHEDQGFPAVIQDIKGMRIAVTGAGATSDQQTRVILSAAGLDGNKDVRIVAIGGATYIPALDKGDIDVVYSYPPYTQQIIRQNLGRKLVDMEGGQGPDLIQKLDNLGTVATEDWIKKNGNTAKEFMAALIEGQQYVATNKQGAAEATAKQLQLLKQEMPVEDILADLGPLQRGFRPDVSPETVQAHVTLLTQAGVIKKPVSYEDVVSPVWKQVTGS